MTTAETKLNPIELFTESLTFTPNETRLPVPKKLFSETEAPRITPEFCEKPTDADKLPVGCSCTL